MTVSVERPDGDTDRRYMERLFRANVADLQAGIIPSTAYEEELRTTLDVHPWALMLVRGMGLTIAGAINSHSPLKFAQLAEPEQGREILDRWRLLEHLAVDKASRRKGIAHALVSAAEAQHRQEGAEHWMLTIDAKNADSVPFYENVGFTILAGARDIPNKTMAKWASGQVLRLNALWAYKSI